MPKNMEKITDKNRVKRVKGRLKIRDYNHCLDRTYWRDAKGPETNEQKNWELFVDMMAGRRKD